jgi:hypothetical protein
MKRFHLLVVAAALVFPALAAAQTFELVSPPNAWYSTPYGIRNGKIYGSYADLTDAKIRAFTYSKTEGFVIFAVPGADDCCGTVAAGIDDTGRVAGYFVQSPQKSLSYVRQANGQLRIFDANPRNSAVTAVTGMNGLGFVTGDYRRADDGLYLPHGYVRSPVGVIFHIDLPGTAMTYPGDINDSGVVTGWYAQTIDSPWRGFIRYPPVFYVTFDPPADCQIADGYHLRINSLGDVAGTCLHDIYFNSGFVRWRTGVVERIDFPGAIVTLIAGIADDGTIAGTYYTAGDVGHGFERSPGGAYTSFDVPGADAATTRAVRIDAQGNITGTYLIGDFQSRTFIRYRQSH